jgi:hypothetical protein
MTKHPTDSINILYTTKEKVEGYIYLAIVFDLYNVASNDK